MRILKIENLYLALKKRSSMSITNLNLISHEWLLRGNLTVTIHN